MPHISFWVYFTRETKPPHSILEKSKPLRRKKGEKKTNLDGDFKNALSAQPKSEACRQLKCDMTASFTLIL